MSRTHIVPKLASGTHNRYPNYEIPKDASQDALNWVTIDGAITLANGRQIMGIEGVSGECRNLWFGTKNNGTKVLYAKYGDKIGYWNGTTLVTIVSGLTVNADYKFQNYTSLAGNFTYATGPDGIYKINNANPSSYLNMYDATKNFKGRCIIDKARMMMVGVTTDPTGLYGSKIDAQGTNYQTVTSETIGTGTGSQTIYSGTLGFKGANPLANCFGLKITQGSNIITDDYNGVITGPNVVIGTINYFTGAYSITFLNAPPNAQAITVSYQWENSNNAGITDFTKSTPRIAGDGFVVRQDEGGDAIQEILIGVDGAYYSAKQYSFYRFYIDSTDTKPTNEVFRKDIGIPYYQSAKSAGMGIIFMNTANPDKPELTLLDKNPLGDSLIPTVLFPHFKFENYYHDMGVIDTWGRYITVSCRTKDSATNNRLLLCDRTNNTVDITSYGVKTLAKDGGLLYGGSPLTQSILKLFAEFDDDGNVIENYWTSRSEGYSINMLKKTRHLRLAGNIDKSQQIGVYVGYSDSDETLAGTIRGDGSYVDSLNPNTVGSMLVGGDDVGGSNLVTVYPYFVEIKLRPPKFDVRTVKFVALAIGYASVNYVEDHDIMTYEERMAKRYRLKQNVALDGGQVNLQHPE